MQTLKRAVARKITEDWRLLFPSLREYEPLRLLRRNGAMLFGICLDRRSLESIYVPTAHVHCLLRPFEMITLTACVQEEPIRVASHERLHREIAQRLARKCPALNGASVSLDEVLGIYESHIRSGAPDSKYPLFMFEEMILLRGLRDAGEAREYLSSYSRVVGSWPEYVLGNKGLTVEVWRKRVEDALAGDLEGVVEQELRRHGLEGWEDYGLVW